MFLFLLLLTTGGYTTASSANQCRALAPSTGLIKSKYRVGVLAIRGVESAYKEFNHTFSKYLTEVAGKEFDPPISFEAVAVPFGKKENDPLNVLTSESDYYDFVFTNPSMFSCIQSEMGASSLVSIISKRRVNGKVHHLTKFGGVIFTLATNTDINTIADIKGKRVGAVSLSGLGR